MMVVNNDCFYNYRSKLFIVKPIFQFVAAPVVFIFVLLSFLVVLIAIFPT